MAFTIRRNLRISFFCCLRRIAPPSSGRERQTVTINKKIEMTVQTLPATVPDSVSATLRVVMKPVESIHPYENNPRYNDSAVPYVKNSIQEFGFKVPIIVDEAGSIVCGHTRYKAALELGMSHVPCIVASDLTPKQIQAFRLVDNKVSEFSSWDFSKLEIEIGELDAEFNLDDFGFFSDSERAGSSPADVGSAAEMQDDTARDDRNIYTGRIITSVYEITGDCPKTEELVDRTRAESLLEEIDRTPGLPDAVRDFLRIAAMRHYVLHFDRIAEFYAHAVPPVQRLMENSCLVIIDYDRAIELGYVQMARALADEYDREYPEEEEQEGGGES